MVDKEELTYIDIRRLQIGDRFEYESPAGKQIAEVTREATDVVVELKGNGERIPRTTRRVQLKEHLEENPAETWLGTLKLDTAEVFVGGMSAYFVPRIVKIIATGVNSGQQKESPVAD